MTELEKITQAARAGVLHFRQLAAAAKQYCGILYLCLSGDTAQPRDTKGHSQKWEWLLVLFSSDLEGRRDRT